MTSVSYTYIKQVCARPADVPYADIGSHNQIGAIRVDGRVPSEELDKVATAEPSKDTIAGIAALHLIQTASLRQAYILTPLYLGTSLTQAVQADEATRTNRLCL